MLSCARPISPVLCSFLGSCRFLGHRLHPSHPHRQGRRGKIHRSWFNFQTFCCILAVAGRKWRRSASPRVSSECACHVVASCHKAKSPVLAVTFVLCSAMPLGSPAGCELAWRGCSSDSRHGCQLTGPTVSGGKLEYWWVMHSVSFRILTDSLVCCQYHESCGVR